MTAYDARTMKNNYLIAGVAAAVSVGLIALFGCAALVAYGKVKGKAASVGMATVQNAETEEKRDPVASLYYEKFHAEYGENLIVADAKYKGKWVKVRGIVGSVRQGPGGDYVIGIGPMPNELNQNVSVIRAVIAKGTEADFAKVKVGHLAEIVAKVTGRQSLGSAYGGYIIAMEDAHLARNGNDEVPSY